MRRAKVFEKSKKRKTRKLATKLYELIVDEYTKAPGMKSAPYAAEADFQLIQPKFDSYRKIQFVGSSKKQQEALKAKFETLKEVEKEYSRMLGYKQADWSLASLYRIGMLYYEAVKTMLNSECPPDVRKQAASLGLLEEEICDEYKIALEEKAYNIEDKAVQAFEFVINKAREFQIVNQWTQQTLERLNELRKAEWPLQKAAKRFIATEAFIRPTLLSTTGDVLKAPAPPEEPEPEPEPETVGEEGAEGAEASEAPADEATAPAEGGEALAPDATAPAEGGEVPASDEAKGATEGVSPEAGTTTEATDVEKQGAVAGETTQADVADEQGTAPETETGPSPGAESDNTTEGNEGAGDKSSEKDEDAKSEEAGAETAPSDTQETDTPASDTTETDSGETP